MKKEKWTVNLTPSWAFAVKGFLMVMESHFKKSMDLDTWKYIKKQLMNVAYLADKYVESVKK